MEPDEGNASLTKRIVEAERERDALFEKAQRLEILQRSFVAIIAAPDEPVVAEAALRGAWLSLGFARGLWFRIESERELNACFELYSGTFSNSHYAGMFPRQTSLYRLTRGDSDAATGKTGDIDAPLLDTRGNYAAAVVRPHIGVPYVLYADGAAALAAWSVASLQELATHAALALDRLRMSNELERLAMHDPLTGLFNRRALMERVQSELATLRRTGGNLAYAMIDVDDFKQINDGGGHAAGDAALKRIAEILRTQTRETDIPARFAGDEFSLVMPRTSQLAIDAIMLRVYEQLRQSGLSASIGIAFADRTMSADELIARADQGVYAAKAAGKGRFVLMP
jgi:diguanylate cyclase (GGDEF)-like protein